MGVLVILLFISASVLVEAFPTINESGLGINIVLTDDDRNFIRSFVTELQSLFEEKWTAFLKVTIAEDDEIPSNVKAFQENLDIEKFFSTSMNIKTLLCESTEPPSPSPTTTTGYGDD